MRHSTHLPCNICRRCKDCLEKFYEFKAVVIETQEMIKTNSFSKRCANLPHPEPAKRSLFGPKKLQYNVSINLHSQNLNEARNYSGMFGLTKSSETSRV